MQLYRVCPSLANGHSASAPRRAEDELSVIIRACVCVADDANSSIQKMTILIKVAFSLRP